MMPRLVEGCPEVRSRSGVLRVDGGGGHHKQVVSGDLGVRRAEGQRGLKGGGLSARLEGEGYWRGEVEG